MPVVALTILLAAALVAAIVFALIATRRGRRLRASQAAVLNLARSFSEDGSSRGRVCAAAQLVAGAEVAFLVEPTPRGDAIRVTTAAGAPGLVGLETPLDPDTSITARALMLGEPIHLPRTSDFPASSRGVLAEIDVRSGHMHPVHHNGRVVGVLGLGWREEQPDLDDERERIVTELAAEAAGAIQRDAHLALLARQARTDDLTALPNRRAWDEAVVREMARAARSGEPMCLALLDLDHFKAYNDRHGHQAGDAHLRRTAAAWRRELRAIDVLARYGGEEFGVLLPSCDIKEAREVVDRVRRATPGGESASAGVVEYDGRERADSLLARADAALYRAKHAGRATTVLA